MSKTNNIPQSTIERISIIYQFLSQLEKQKQTIVFSDQLGKFTGSSSDSIRKDFSVLKIGKNHNKGYNITHLKHQIALTFGFNQKRKSCIIGLGRVGTAILEYPLFLKEGFEIIAGFDNSLNRLERISTNIPLFHISDLEVTIKMKKIVLAIISTPAEVTQSICDRLVSAGIQGILNFAPVALKAPENVIVNNLDFMNALRIIAAKLSLNQQGVENGTSI